MARTLRLDPVVLLRDPDRTNFYLRLSAAQEIWKQQKAQAEKQKRNKPGGYRYSRR